MNKFKVTEDSLFFLCNLNRAGRKRGWLADWRDHASRSGHDDDARFGTFSLAFLFCSRGPFAVVFGVL